MTVADEGRVGPLEWAVAARALPGQPVSGDDYVVTSGGDQVTMAVIDGLGHGPLAAEAADRAVQTIRGIPDEPVDVVIERCHEALRDSRGAAVTVLQVGLSDGTVTSVGVGDVDAWILRRSLAGTVDTESVFPASGVVGLAMPVLRPRTAKLRRGDVVIMATDGIKPTWPQSVRHGRRAATTAQQILEGHARPVDDALVLTALYRGVG